ncbi:uncharacterized protein ARMOST_10308 [Armillaria ostoyae]|uniref:Uncharacterized protein n=1 Tax=Armillaria ostoyae TaxID=47428 RepID=A0A284RDY4_ARMOS|nr:uncharacterized protein ARMOST_10308 [Armillaria ostoyae]
MLPADSSCSSFHGVLTHRVARVYRQEKFALRYDLLYNQSSSSSSSSAISSIYNSAAENALGTLGTRSFCVPKIAAFLRMKSGFLCSDRGKPPFHSVFRALFLTLKERSNEMSQHFEASFFRLDNVSAPAVYILCTTDNLLRSLSSCFYGLITCRIYSENTHLSTRDPGLSKKRTWTPHEGRSWNTRQTRNPVESLSMSKSRGDALEQRSRLSSLEAVLCYIPHLVGIDSS